MIEFYIPKAGDKITLLPPPTGATLQKLLFPIHYNPLLHKGETITCRGKSCIICDYFEKRRKRIEEQK